MPDGPSRRGDCAVVAAAGYGRGCTSGSFQHPGGGFSWVPELHNRVVLGLFCDCFGPVWGALKTFLKAFKGIGKAFMLTLKYSLTFFCFFENVASNFCGFPAL